MLEKGKKEEAMLYYFYMLSDGEKTYSEEKFFDEICSELSLSEEEKCLVAETCEEIISADPMPVFETILSEKLDEILEKESFGIEKKDDSSLARIIWNLVNLGYADTYYSEEEKEIVSYLVKRWKIKQEVYQEMVDTADTMLALTKQKEWVISTFPKGRARDEKEKRLDSEISTMLSDIKITIEELTM